MSMKGTLSALPTLMKVSFAEAVAYRAEMLIWVFSTTMPLIMLALWSAVARDAPVGRFGQSQFIAYFLATFIVRQLTGSWAAWQLTMEIRQGVLSMRLLRPIHPLWGYVTENLAAVPLRVVVALPVAVIALASVGAGAFPHDPFIWGLWLLSMLGGWLVTFLANVCVGTLSFFIGSSLKVMDVYLACFMVFSGYLLPVELFPPFLQKALLWLPFRYQIGLSVELLTGAYGRMDGLAMLGHQWTYVVALFALMRHSWSRGIRRFEAFGG